MDEPEQLVARLELLGRRGLADAAAALLGGEPARTLDILARQGELPWIAGCCWTALAPLAVGPPRDAGSALLRRLLVSGQVDELQALRAIVECPAAPGPLAVDLPTSGRALADGLWQGALLGAYEDLWERVTWVYEDAGVLVRFGRPEDIPDVLQAASVGLERAADRVALLARQVAGRFQPTDEPAPEHHSAPPSVAGTPPVVALAHPPGPVLVEPPPVLVEGAPETVELPTDAEPAAVDDDDDQRIREHRILPIAFLVLVTAAAGGYLYSLVYGWPPQLP